VGAAVAIGVVIVAVVIVLGRRGGVHGPAAPDGTIPGGMSGMAGMPGMAMGGDGGPHLTTDQVRQFGVTFGTVEVRRLTAEVHAVGNVTADERRLAQVTSRVAGYVDRLYVNATGQVVRQGQPLAEIYSPELVAAQEELLLAARLDRAAGGVRIPGLPADSAGLIASARRRLALWEISDAQIDDVLRSGQPRRTLTLYAPVSGVVTDKRVVNGQAVEAGAPLYVIADLSRVWIDVNLRETDAPYVRPGSAVAVDLVAYPGRPIAGRVDYVYPTLDSMARAVHARVAIANPGGRVMPGMYATVHVVTSGRSALTVPASALLNTGDQQLVFVDMGEGRIRPQPVETGQTAGAYTEVLSGLKPGQKVITSAQFLLDAESNLSEVMQRMVGQMNMSDMKSGTGRQ
jgi:Cu(I)/Ag(I) efflux system membrane fusion protein